MKAVRIMESAGVFLSFSAIVLSVLFSLAANRQAKDEVELAQTVSKSVNVFEEFRQERARVRSLETVQLTALMADESADEEIRIEAARALNAMNGFMEAETTIEGVLKVRGYENAVVTVHASSVNVVVDEKNMSATEHAFILDLVMRETGQTAGNVKIIAGT